MGNVLGRKALASEVRVQSFGHNNLNIKPIPTTRLSQRHPVARNSGYQRIAATAIFPPGQAAFDALTEPSRQTGFPVTTVQRITETLCGRGYLRKDGRKRYYYISVRSLDLLYRFQMGNGLIQSIWPRLIRLREECGLRCFFCVLDGTEIVHFLHVQSRPQPAFRTAYHGRRLPAVSSSGGRAMLSWLSE